MLLHIDPRAGSNKLIERFPGECEVTTLEFGDVAFWGEGPDNIPWWIGVEYKKSDDMVASLKSGRFTGTQLPGMLRMYDICFVVIEGITFMDRNNGALMKKMGKYSTGLRIQYGGYQNFLTSVAVHSALSGKPCIIKHTVSTEETVGMIKATYNWFQKPWEWHTSISRPDLTKIQRVAYDLEVLKTQPEAPEYPQYMLRKQLFQIDGIGWEVAGKLSEHFRTAENALRAPQKEWESIERVGKGLATRIYFALHGYADATIKKRRAKDLPVTAKG